MNNKTIKVTIFLILWIAFCYSFCTNNSILAPILSVIILAYGILIFYLEQKKI